jgi:hypothetical protein
MKTLPVEWRGKERQQQKKVKTKRIFPLEQIFLKHSSSLNATAGIGSSSNVSRRDALQSSVRWNKKVLDGAWRYLFIFEGSAEKKARWTSRKKSQELVTQLVVVEIEMKFLHHRWASTQPYVLASPYNHLFISYQMLRFAMMLSGVIFTSIYQLMEQTTQVKHELSAE